MNAITQQQTIQFFDLDGETHTGIVKESLSLSDDYGEFYLVQLETPEGNCYVELEDLNGYFLGERWAPSKSSTF